MTEETYVESARGSAWPVGLPRGPAYIELTKKEWSYLLPAQRRFYLRKVRLNNGGYDSGGAYWGVDEPLYRYESVDGEANGFLRARSREAAIAAIREEYPAASFFGESRS